MNMNGHQIFQMLVYAGIGVWALVLGRKTYSHPEMLHDRWLRGSLPRRKWLLRTMAAVWVFSGFIALGSALASLPAIRARCGDALLELVLSISLAGTIIVLGSTPRHDSVK